MRLDNNKYNLTEQVKLVTNEFLFPTMLLSVKYQDTYLNRKAIAEARENNDYVPIFQNYDSRFGVLARIKTGISDFLNGSYFFDEDERENTCEFVVQVIKVIQKNSEDTRKHRVIVSSASEEEQEKEYLSGFSYDLAQMQEFMEMTGCTKRLVTSNNSYTVARYVYEQARKLCKEGRADYDELLQLGCSSLFVKIFNIVKEGEKTANTNLRFFSESEAYDYIMSHNYPEEVKKVVMMEKDNRDGRGKTLSFMNALANFPWNTKKKEEVDVAKFKETLETAHYGLDEVKERVVENMIVKQHAKNKKAQILCLVGSPGVGKTSFAKSIAKAMNLPFYKISMSGANDATILKGSNRCWAGSTIGQLASALCKSGCLNPVILIDEIEKTKTSNEGNATEVLLEALDTSQNSEFVDDFLSVGIDLSNVTFICTANYPEKIPAPLKDRMEMIFLPDYSAKERKTIFSKYVLPAARKENELSNSQLVVKNDAVDFIVENYSVDGGIRNLQRCADRLCCKAWVAIEEGQEKLIVTKDNVKDLLGEGLSCFKNIQDTKAQVGVVNAMVINGLNKGGINKIECVYTDGSGKLEITGNLTEMAKESCQVAFDHIKWQAENYGIEKGFFQNHDVLVHFTNTATLKDGNSAGIALVTAIISALTENKTIDHMSLTGEISLRGNVSKIGGLRQKVEGAKENGIKTVIFPKENEKDLQDIPDDIKKGIKLIPVETYKEAYGYIFA